MSLIIQSEQNIFKTKFSTLGGFIVVLLSCSILALLERVMYDISRFFVPPPLNYFNNLSVIIIQTIFVFVFLMIALFINLEVKNNREKYVIALLPYFMVSIFLSIQVILQMSVYFYNHHTNFQFYVVMIGLVIFCTLAIYQIQRNYKVIS